jgi:class 3 adenylate cyclase
MESAALLAYLSRYEPIISAAVGLLTLAAALWGLVQFALLPLLARRHAADDSPEAERFRLWSSMVDRGLSPESDLPEQVDVRTFNIILVLFIAATLCWLVATLQSAGTLVLSVINFIAFLVAITAYNLHAAGRRLAAKWLFMSELCLIWCLNLVMMGPGVGLEYFLGGLMAVPLLLFRDEQRTPMVLCAALALMMLPLALALQAWLDLEPLAADRGSLPGYYYVNAVVLAVLAALILYNYNRSADESFSQLEDQKRKSDELIHRIVPAYIARRMAERGTTVADWHSEASVLFATVEGFEALYRRVSAVQIVELLAEVFGEFDAELARAGVEKINTLGTNYVAVAGISPGGASHEDLARAALAMRATVIRFSDTVGHPFGLRAGISTGDVLSGVIGEARPSFDVWGRTVEIANAMRDSALDNSIVVNEAAYWRLRPAFEFAPCEAARMQEAAYLLLRERS